MKIMADYVFITINVAAAVTIDKAEHKLKQVVFDFYQ